MCIMAHTFLYVFLRIMRVPGARKGKRHALLVIACSIPKIAAVAAQGIAAVAAQRIVAVAARGPVYGTPTIRSTHNMEFILVNASQGLMLHNNDRRRRIHGIPVTGAIFAVLTSGGRTGGDRSRGTR